MKTLLSKQSGCDIIRPLPALLLNVHVHNGLSSQTQTQFILMLPLQSDGIFLIHQTRARSGWRLVNAAEAAERQSCNLIWLLFVGFSVSLPPSSPVQSARMSSLIKSGYNLPSPPIFPSHSRLVLLTPSS